MSSNDIALSVRGLSKEYTITHEEMHTTLGEKFVTRLKNPLHRPEREIFRALDNVSFDVKKGEVVGIIGRNGAGKSTLLKILSRITEPTAGEIKLYGRVGSLLEVGTGFHPELTGRENIFLNGAILGMKVTEIRKCFDEIVAFSEIEKFLDTPVKRYSSGMYVRLAFAVAAHLNPEILIIDEVLAVGDAEFQKKCLGKMKQVAEGEGKTILFVSHNIAAVRSLCNSAVWLKAGRRQLIGKADRVCGAYIGDGNSGENAKVKFSRPGNAAHWMAAANLECGGRTDGILAMGEQIIIEIDFFSEVAIIEPAIGFVINGADGERILGANNRFIRGPLYSSPVKSGRIRINLGQVPLMAGRHSISLWFGNPTADTHVVLDALSFQVIERDCWGHGATPPPSSALMWWPASFDMLSASGDDSVCA
jgi:lipopolysaccharide transport system ATP-binding protein